MPYKAGKAWKPDAVQLRAAIDTTLTTRNAVCCFRPILRVSSLRKVAISPPRASGRSSRPIVVASPVALDAFEYRLL
jgi:hypothetical protein